MSGWTVHNGQAVALPLENIDTDQLIPARFMSTPRSAGYGQFLLHDLRDADPGFPLARHPRASILVAGRNFGSGSSREAAVYALVDFGIRAVIAPSFGDIFKGNAVNNGLLAATVPEDDVTALLGLLGTGVLPASVDLEASCLVVGDTCRALDLDPVARRKLMKGWDDIDLTQAHTDEIAAFRAQRRAQVPWAWPA